MRIAVLIPVYNCERYLRGCLDSVLAAAGEVEKAGHSLEVFCIDDGATDGSGAILDGYAARYPEMIRVRHQENRGMVATNNRLMDELPDRIEAFGFVDSDDYIHPEMYARLSEALVRTQSDVAECGIVSVPFESAYPSGLPKPPAGGEDRIIEDMSVYWLRSTSPGRWINKVNKLYRRSAVRGIRFRDGLNYEDDIFFNCEVNAIVRRKVIIPGSFYAYRKNPDSLNGELNLKRYFAAVTERLRLSCEVFLAADRVPAAFRRGFCADLAKDAYRMVIRKNLKKNRNPTECKELFFAAGLFLRSLEQRWGFVPVGLNPLQSLIWRACRSGRYRTARLLTYLT